MAQTGALGPSTGAASPASSAPAGAERTLPPGIAWVEDGVIAPGTYWFDGFDPTLELRIPGAGWEVGHFHDEIFDLFFRGDFPAIAFARFPMVATAGGGTEAATSVDVIIEALSSNPDVKVVDGGPVEVAGLDGQTIDVSVTRAQTALFGSGGEGFHFDPGFVGRFHLLQVGGGAVEIFVVDREGALDAAIEATQPILDSVRVVE